MSTEPNDALDLNNALDLDNLSRAQQTMLEELQGNVLQAHGRDDASMVFLRFENADAGKRYLKWLGRVITRMSDQLRTTWRLRAVKSDIPGDPISGQGFLSVALSKKGYEALGISPDAIPSDGPFEQGMKVHGPVSLLDPQVSTWDKPYREDLHAMLLIAHDTAKSTLDYKDLLLSRMPEGVVAVHDETGASLKNKANQRIEHFGYLDGGSSPVFIKQDLPDRRSTKGNPLTGLDIVLTKCPGGGDSSYGSYLVFRKLEQDVRKFARIELDLASKLSVTPDEAGALIIGRRKDGTSPMQAVGQPYSNDFDYSADPFGHKCPLGAHVRKVNPRGATFPSNPVAGSEAERRAWIVRRSITYGEREDDASSPTTEETIRLRPEKDVGLLFMCYQQSIRIRFEEMQRAWANDKWFPRAPTTIDGRTRLVMGLDPVIGRPHPGERFPAESEEFNPSWPGADGKLVPYRVPQCVTLKGGEYFFVPSLSFFRNLNV